MRLINRVSYRWHDLHIQRLGEALSCNGAHESYFMRIDCLTLKLQVPLLSRQTNSSQAL